MASELEMRRSDTSYWDVIKRNGRGGTRRNPPQLPPESERVTATMLEGGDRVDLRLEKSGRKWQWYYVSGGAVGEGYDTAQQAVNAAKREFEGFRMEAREGNPRGDSEDREAEDLAEGAYGALSEAFNRKRYGWVKTQIQSPFNNDLELHFHIHDDKDVSAQVFDGRGRGKGAEVVVVDGGKDMYTHVQDVIHFFLHHGSVEGWEPFSEGMTEDEADVADAEELFEESRRGNPASQVVQTIARQLRALGMPRRGIQLVAWDENTLKVNKGARGSIIRYNHATDLYDVTPYEGLKMGGEIEGVGVEELFQVVGRQLGIKANPELGGTRERRLEFLWRETPRAYRSGRGSGRKIMVRTDSGSALVPLANLTNDEIDTALGLREGESRVGNPTPSPYDRPGWQAMAQGVRRYSLEALADEYERLGYETDITDGPKVRGKKSWRLYVRGPVREMRSNPLLETSDDDGQQAAAADKYAEFHGRESTEQIILEDDIEAPTDLAVLGALVKLKVKCLSGITAEITFDPGREYGGNAEEDERPLLSCSPDGKQLYLRGGDQSIDLSVVKMEGKKWLKDSMIIGEITNIEYQTEKGFDEFKLITYYHKLGEETKVRPFLVYDTINKLLVIAGGQYDVRPEGIVN